MSSDRPTYINQATDTSPFSSHRELILGKSSAGIALQDFVLGCWSGSAYPANLSKLPNLDPKYRAVALEIFDHYARYGENDRAFMALAEEIVEARRARDKLED